MNGHELCLNIPSAASLEAQFQRRQNHAQALIRPVFDRAYRWSFYAFACAETALHIAEQITAPLAQLDLETLELPCFQEWSSALILKEIQEHEAQAAKASFHSGRELPEALTAIPKELRLPFILYFIEGFSWKTLGRFFRQSPRALEQRVQSGLRALQEELFRNGQFRTERDIQEQLFELRQTGPTCPSPLAP